MRRKSPWSLEDLDPDMQAVALDAARQAGLSVEEWIAAAIADRASRPGEKAGRRRSELPALDLEGGAEEPRGRSAPLPERRSAPRGAAAREAAARFADRAEEPPGETPRGVRERQDRTGTALAEAIRSMTLRLADIERKVVDGSEMPIAAALKAVEKLEAHLAKRDETDRSAIETARIEALLRGFESRIAQIGERVATARAPAGRRPEVLSAVDEIRARQRMLDEPGSRGATERRPSAPVPAPPARDDALAGLRADFARLAEQLGSVREAAASSEGPSSAVTALRADMTRLNDTIGRLATRGEVGAIERAVRDLAAQVAEARRPGDLAEVTGPIAELQDEVRRLSGSIATDVQGRVALDLDRLGRRIDQAAARGADPRAIDGLADQLAGLREILQDLAEPRRIEGLIDSIAELSTQVAEFTSRQIDAREFTSLRSAVDEIRSAVKAPRPAAEEAERRFESLSRKIDDLRERQVQPNFDRLSAHLEAVTRHLEDRTSSDDLAEKVESLAAKLDRMAVREDPRAALQQSTAMESLMQRLDRLDDRLRRPEPKPDLKPIEDMLRGLADKLDRVERAEAGGEALDALEKQVGVLVSRLERSQPAADPAFASLERAMTDLMAQVDSLRDGTVEAAERAARSALEGSLDRLPRGGLDEHSPLTRDLAELKARTSAADDRVQSALQAVHATLEKVASKLSALEADAASEILEPPPGRREPRQALGVRPSRTGVPASKPTARATVLPEADRPIPPADDVLIEPGAGRPRPSQASEARSEPDARDVTASMIAQARIAQARRAAQAAASEVAATGPSAAGRSPLAALGSADPAGAIARIRATLEKRRRPLLMGLAAIVLALGALQGVSLFRSSEAPPAPAKPAIDVPAIPAPAPVPAPPPPARDAGPPDASPAEPAPPPARQSENRSLPTMALPPTASLTQTPSLVPPAVTGAVDARPAAAGTPIANIGTVGEIPTTVPAGLRTAALAGDPTAVLELASRAAEGRGMPRDPKLAAKLFERAALHGIVPAQYRIGNHYEKGLGIGRDLTLAKMWYQRAAEKGNARAMHNIAVLLAEGGGAKPDYAGAIEWFKKAAELGVRDSQFNLAVLYARGLGVSQDLVQSYLWFAAAAGQGDGDAAKKRDEVAGRLSPQDLSAAQAQAARWKPQAQDAAANDVPPPARSWAEPVKASPGQKA